MPDDVKPRRRRWRVTLYNPDAGRGQPHLSFKEYIETPRRVEAEGSTMGRAFTRALEAAGGAFLTVPHDYCGAAVHAFNMARDAFLRKSMPAYRVSVQIRYFTVEIERVR
jgi:hypothetical protein